MLSKSGLITILVFCGISQSAAIGIGVMLVRKNDAMARDLQKLQIVWGTHTKKPVFCETLQTVLPPPPAPQAPTNPTPAIPPHRVYIIGGKDRTMYGIAQRYCQTKSYIMFETDMLALGKIFGNPHPIEKKEDLTRIKAGQTWWLPPYCTFPSPVAPNPTP